MPKKVVIFWYRRDLRLDDNAGLYQALISGFPVVPVFIFDTEILDELEEKADRRVDFIHQAIHAIQDELVQIDSSLHILHGKPVDCFRELMQIYDIHAVFTNHDYEPYARKRDEVIAALLKKENIVFYSYKDQVIFEKDEVTKKDGDPYVVYTPYSRQWKSVLKPFYLKPYPVNKYRKHFYQQSPKRIPSLSALGFKKTDVVFKAPKLDAETAKAYHKTRDYPYIEDGTTKMSVHLRFGTLSIRQLAAQAKEINDTLFGELIWREFYQMILWHFPNTVSDSFRKEYDHIRWRNNEEEFKRWCEGRTGFPIVDAGMRELNTTGYMHNRVRMIVGSFLVKDLLVDWRWGEAYFASKLLDYDMAANIGNWQWVAGCGCDAAPYFRIYNPHTQAGKFDPDQAYIKKWIPELDTKEYPEPIVDHSEARERCLNVFKAALHQS